MSGALQPALDPARERAVLLTLAGLQFTHILDFMIMMPLGPQFTRLFGLSAQQFGLLVSAYTFAAAAAAVLAALLVDRFERRATVLLLATLFLLATLACAAAPGYGTLLAARALAGAFGGVLGAMIYTLVGDLVPEARRGRAMGLVMSSFSVSTVAGVPLGLLIAAWAGWRWTFVFVALLTALFVLAALRTLPRIDAHLARAHSHPLRELWLTLADANHLRAFGFMLLMMFAGFSVIPFISLYMVANVGLREAELSWLYLAGGVATLYTARRIGRLADRHGKLVTYRVLALLSIAPLLAVTHAPALPLAAAIAVATLFFVLVSGRMIPGMALVTGSAAAGRRGAFMSLNSAVQQLGSGLAATVAGMIIVKLPAGDGGHILHYERVGWLAVVCTLLAIAWAGRIVVRDAGPRGP